MRSSGVGGLAGSASLRELGSRPRNASAVYLTWRCPNPIRYTLNDSSLDAEIAMRGHRLTGGRPSLDLVALDINHLFTRRMSQGGSDCSGIVWWSDRT